MASLNVFIQIKKSQGLQYYSQGKNDAVTIALLNEDRIFEEAHNTMISRLNSFQSLHPKEKILWAMATLTDFDKFYQAALASKIKL